MAKETSTALTALDEYRLLGHSGLRVSPLSLGAMTFGTTWQSVGFGVDFEQSKKLFDYYVERGGNFIDTANNYTEGESERFVGNLIAERRSQMVVATKYSLNIASNIIPGPVLPRHNNPLLGGNSRKSLVENLDASLKRLGTGYVDLLYVHVWDLRTPIEETLRALDDTVRSGKALYIALSDTPSWVASYANATANLRGWTPFIGIQTRYNLLERSLENNILPMAKALDIGIIPWGALSEGFLTGKLTRDSVAPQTLRGSRLAQAAAVPKNWEILDEVNAISKEVGRTPAQVSLNWMLNKKGITSPLLGVSKLEQLQDNIAALEFRLTPEQLARLDAVSAPVPDFPNGFVSLPFTTGDKKVEQRYFIGGQNI